MTILNLQQTLIEPQLHKERFPSEFVSTVKYCCKLSKGILGKELFVVCISNTFPKMKSAYTLLCNVVKNLGNTFSDVHNVVEIVQRTRGSTMELEHWFSTLKMNSTAQECHHNTLAVQSIHKDVIVDILRCKQKATRFFASRKNRRHFLYKQGNCV
jgi:hypothetical protein